MSYPLLIIIIQRFVIMWCGSNDWCFIPSCVKMLHLPCVLRRSLFTCCFHEWIFVCPTVFCWWWRSPSVSFVATSSTTTNPSTSVYKMSIGIILDLTLEGLHLRNQCIYFCLYGCVGMSEVFNIFGMVVNFHISLILFHPRLSEDAP